MMALAEISEQKGPPGKGFTNFTLSSRCRLCIPENFPLHPNDRRSMAGNGPRIDHIIIAAKDINKAADHILKVSVV